MMLGACAAGVMTLHLLMPEVLAERPERVRTDVDGYIATVECRHLGELMTLLLNGRRFRVVVADCATTRPVGQWPSKGGRPWLGDVELKLWDAAGAPMRPTAAVLCGGPGAVSLNRRFEGGLARAMASPRPTGRRGVVASPDDRRHNGQTVHQPLLFCGAPRPCGRPAHRMGWWDGC